MSEVLELLSSELDENRIREIAAHLDADPAQTQAAIAAALPTLVAAMGRTADTEQGSQMIASRMQGIGGESLGDLLGGLINSSAKRANSPSAPRGKSNEFEDILPPGFEAPASMAPQAKRSSSASSGSSRPDPLERSLGPGNELPSDSGRQSDDYDGSFHSSASRPSSSPSPSPSSSSLDDVLGKVLGGKQKRVEDSIGKSSGLDLRKIGPLLAILAPLVLGAMKSRASSRSSGNSKTIDPSDLTKMMRGERSSIEQKAGGSLIGRMLDQDGDGDFDLSDIMSLGMKFLFPKR